MNRIKFKEQGFVVTFNTIIFLAISLIIIFGIILPIMSSNVSAKAMVKSKQSFLVANSATEEAVYRLKSGLELASSETLVLSTGTASINIADTFDGKKITVNSFSDIYQRNLQVELIEGTGVSFNYGLQTGQGGFEMGGGAGVAGNVYSNGDIVGSGGPWITGSATSANVSDPEADQMSVGVIPPSNQVDFGGNSTPQDAAQSFTVSTATPITSVRFYIKKSSNNWMNNVTVKITTDNGGKPSKSIIASANLSAQQVTTSFNYLGVPFTSAPSLAPGMTYWIVLDTGTTWGSYYSLGSQVGVYGNGLAKVGEWRKNNGGNWSNTSPSGQDIYFDLYVGGDTGLISGITVGSSGGDAWSHEVNNSNVSGTIYCQASSGNNKACDTSRPDPVEQPFPISDGNILDWKDQAVSGGFYVGDRIYGGNDEGFLGPLKIEGDLTVGSGAILNVTGTLWVTGDVSVTGGAVVRLSADHQEDSGIIVTDGRVTASGGGQFQGSGDSGSYILLVTTSTCPEGCGSSPAVSVSGGTGSVILNAQKGTIRFTGGAHAKQATANKIEMTGGTTVTYEEGLADMTFSSGPSGGWEIVSWDEI